MSKKCGKLLSSMRDNPKSDWTIEDIQKICDNVGVSVMAPTRGSHYKIASDLVSQYVLTIPYNRPIKAPYIKQFVKLIDAHIERCMKGGER
jgi:hypothetical protein